jgi:hypothetical protein
MLDRQDIRLATVAVLKAAQTDAGDRVYPTWILPYRRELPLPAIGVYTLDESGEGINGAVAGAFQFHYALKLVIELVAASSDATLEPAARLMLDSQAGLDVLCEQVSDATLRNPAWYKYIHDGRICQRFSGIDRWDTALVAGRVEDTDQRTMGAQISATLRFERQWDPIITDDFCRLNLDVDVIDPAADPNIKYPGPDGRIEVRVEIPRTGIGGGPVETLCDPPPPRRTH